MPMKVAGAAAAILVTACCSSWAQPALDFHTLTPCRVVDTRPGAPLGSSPLRIFPIAGVCSVPYTARVVSANLTVVGPTGSGFVTLWPAGLPEPSTSTINFSSGMTRANNALLALDDFGRISAKAFLADSGSVQLIIDVTGYMAGAPVNQCECPLLVFGVSPFSGSVGQSMTISGQSFAQYVQVLFGDATTGSSAMILAYSSTSITVVVPSPSPSFTFSSEPCDANGDGILGTRLLPTPISVNVLNLDGIFCEATLNNAFRLNPSPICNEPAAQPSASVDTAGPSNGSGTAAGSMAGVPAPQCQCPIDGMPLPLISGITPSSGNLGTPVTISGQSFAPHVQVMFGDATNGSPASISSSSSTSITAMVPQPPPGFTFSTEPCDSNADGIFGTRLVPTPISVNVRNLDGAGCVATLSNEFTLNPPNTVCTEP